MSITDGEGVRIWPVVAKRPKTLATSTEVQRARDIALVKMRKRQQSWRAIGAFLGMSYEGARRRWNAIPEAVREHYGRTVG